MNLEYLSELQFVSLRVLHFHQKKLDYEKNTAINRCWNRLEIVNPKSDQVIPTKYDRYLEGRHYIQWESLQCEAPKIAKLV